MPARSCDTSERAGHGWPPAVPDRVCESCFGSCLLLAKAGRRVPGRRASKSRCLLHSPPGPVSVPLGSPPMPIPCPSHVSDPMCLVGWPSVGESKLSLLVRDAWLRRRVLIWDAQAEPHPPAHANAMCLGLRGPDHQRASWLFRGQVTRARPRFLGHATNWTPSAPRFRYPRRVMKCDA